MDPGFSSDVFRSSAHLFFMEGSIAARQQIAHVYHAAITGNSHGTGRA